MILYNTCSIREKAAQKVFSRLGELRPTEERAARSEQPAESRARGLMTCLEKLRMAGGIAQNVGGSQAESVTGSEHPSMRKMVNAGGEKIIGVLGCVAQQEGEGIFERAPWVSLVCGSASYRKLPQLIAELEAGNRRVMGLDIGHGRNF